MRLHIQHGSSVMNPRGPGTTTQDCKLADSASGAPGWLDSTGTAILNDKGTNKGIGESKRADT